MDQKQLTRRATVHDVAREAGVSLATVDRVLNSRPGVRPATASRVEEAIRTLDFRRDLSASLLARARDLRIVFLIPAGRNEFMRHLEAALAGRVRAARAERVTRQCDCAVIVATDDKKVRKAIDAATRRGIPIVTLVSDLPDSVRRHFVGIDNRAAGRTAASLLGRFCPSGEIGIVAGSLDLRDHAERLEGFTAIMHDEFPGHKLIGPVEGLDDNATTEKQATQLLKQHSGLTGLYNVGAGNLGLMRAIEKSGRARDIRVVAHELAGPTRKGLMTGVIDVVLDQNPEGEVRAAIAAARALALGTSGDLPAEPIEIGIFLRDNLRQDNGPAEG